MSEGPEAIGGLPDDERWSEQMHRAALERKGALADCEACGSNAWGVGQRLLLLPALDASGSWVAGRGVDAIPVFCRRCGLLRLHAATILLRD